MKRKATTPAGIAKALLNEPATVYFDTYRFGALLEEEEASAEDPAGRFCRGD
ncbi:hypothetical protein [Alteribacter aurantiacus]|uniref:hypothetical protein n=1 Tax=Alteribacter aurantiacus TaxID=254410 RepID=UPI00040DA434|nr:hypothetical protein [Alteribacter aurantiacus]